MQLYKVQRYIIWVKLGGVWKTRSRFGLGGGGGIPKLEMVNNSDCGQSY